MPDLRTILADLGRRAGLDPDVDMNLKGLAARIPGMVLSSRATVRSCMESLQQAFPLDAVESDGVLVFRERGSAPAATLGEADLVPYDDGSLVQIVRRQESELPRQVDVLYSSTAADFQTCTQSARRLTGAALSVTSVELPLALDDGRARHAAERLLAEQWLERTQYAFRLTTAWAQLDPADVVLLTFGGRTARLRLTRVETTTTVVMVQAVPDDPGLLDPTVPAAVPAAKLSVVRVLEPSTLFPLDLPLLRDEDDGPGWYAAASLDGAEGRAWPGAVLMESMDGGASFARLADLRGPCTWGTCESVLGDGPATHWDEANVLRVHIRRGQLESRDRLAVLNGANAALIGGEIFQFREAALVAASTYELSGLLRGRRGTEHRTGGHGPGETFVLLRAADLIRVRGRRDRLGASSLLKAVTVGLHAADQAAQGFANTAAGLRPFAVAHPRGRREANGDWRITWIRRTRLSDGWIDGADVPLGEESEHYEVDILTDGGGVRRTLGVAAPAATYTAAMQQADFGGSRASLRVRIAQFSAAVGRGTAREVTL